MKRISRLILFVLVSFSCMHVSNAEHSIARKWNELLLEAIRNDYARPTVHARNLFHVSIAMYDAWAAYSCKDETLFLGKTTGPYPCPFDGMLYPDDVEAARDTAISYAAYRLLTYRFQNSPGAATMLPLFDAMMTDTLGFDKNFTSTVYQDGSAAALGNHLAQNIIFFGLVDGSNEFNEYNNEVYVPINPPIVPILPGNPDIIFPNNWQPIALELTIDQSGNVVPDDFPDFLSPEWGNVVPFALDTADRTTYQRFGSDFHVYHDPGAPPYIDTVNGGAMTEEFKWGFMLVSIWGSHLDPADSVMVDISPGSFGNFPITSYPQSIAEYRMFYDSINGGDPGTGHAMNPKTGQPYTPQIVPRGDYARVLAEFWADGPDSETPPGHWYTILNYVNDHPDLVKSIGGIGDTLDDLEWDVKSYLLLGGGMHDAAITAWGAKGYYDYLRPISAIRMMADFGQCSDTSLSNYHIAGVPLRPGFVEMVDSNDVLAGDSMQHVGKIKLYTWKGPDSIGDPLTTTAGVGWILAENWWPYQRPTFVTPPFAGYVSGHSTYSRAAAEILTYMTGDPFFPGGMGEFVAEKDSFLVFEDGPSVDITLQWATYRDASDQTSLSRIWGGIHPPADDIPGRIMGEQIGIDAWDKAQTYWDTCNAYSGHFFIIPIPRTSSSFSSLQEAFDCFASCGISDTVTIEILPGVSPVTGPVVIDSIPGNDINSPVRITGDNIVIETPPGSPFTVGKGVYLLFGDQVRLREE